MLKIRKNGENNILVVSKGAYNSIFKKLGYTVVEGAKENKTIDLVPNTNQDNKYVSKENIDNKENHQNTKK